MSFLSMLVGVNLFRGHAMFLTLLWLRCLYYDMRSGPVHILFSTPLVSNIEYLISFKNYFYDGNLF